MTQSHRSSRRRLSWNWVILAIVYAVFFFWYTSFEGPLSDEEIAHYTEVLAQTPEIGDHGERWIGFMESDTGNDFAMWNAVDLLDTPRLVEGVEPGDSSQEVVDRYTEPFFGQALLRASHPVMGGNAANTALDIWGIEGGENWDAGLLVRYRSRRDLMEMMEEMATAGANIHTFKVAAVEKTIAFPIDPWFYPGDPRFLLALVFIGLGLAFQLRYNARTASSALDG